ncbi:esterase/lipase family protein [Persicirhabdus sediminis]|uniref:Alpha/beta hydrolase n=1 Tax=Persicirhabdus sediminis TaxID=454144 RepID=A0A8J7SJ33_9BACT|nr:alpha/beta fold hydrolase [Persicirhabdus sediminis]MBK1790856.1 alpha/beta hydrolase [Persicirhabdus sediminis]
MKRILFQTTLALAGLAVTTAAEHVVLLHGLCRSSKSMEKMNEQLSELGYTVHNVDYESRTAEISELSEEVISAVLLECNEQQADKVHFVTHSMGGIMVRHYLANNKLPQLGRVVMLAPPNQGSEVVDKIGDWKAFKKLNGPAGQQLSTAESSVPNQLGAVKFQLGVIAGDRSINGINSMMIDGDDDGKVSVERTKVEGMSDHVVIHSTHPMIMKNDDAIELTARFLKTGKFADDTAD